ncbi:MAG: hypothetical protein V3T70_09705, partial [Phycisphaerae bacterium]
PGTKMPQWWGEGGSLESFPAEAYDDFASRYGERPDEQMVLLLDFMYEAGLRNHTVIDPSLTAEAEEEGDVDIDLGDEFGEDEEPEIDLDDFDL